MSTLIEATLKRHFEDFIVEEIPLYLPCGTGEHVYVTFEKRGKNTLDVVRDIARALGANQRDVGVAGMKDKYAVTRQTISLTAPRGQKTEEFAERALQLAIDGVRILSVGRHNNKLRTGHLEGNKFEIVLRDIDPLRLQEACERSMALTSGVPNAFGEQRFGRGKDNAERARAWLRGEEAPPRDHKKTRLLYSALQSAVFNAVLDRRVSEGTWRTPILGDVLEKTDSGGRFVCTDVEVDRERALRGEVVPTGPMLGPKMVKPEADAATLEAEVAASFLGEDEIVSMLTNASGLGEGTRRPLVLPVQKLSVEPISPSDGEQPTGCRVYFVIPKGAYATTVLAQVFVWKEQIAPAIAETESNSEASQPEGSHRDD